MYVTLLGNFQPIKLSRENHVFVNSNLPVNDLLCRLQSNPTQFRDLKNFTIDEFFELWRRQVVPTIERNAWSIGPRHVLSGRHVKLTLEQRLLNFVIYMKHDNVIYFDSFLWNLLRSTVCDDALFVASCLNEALQDETRWPMTIVRRGLANHIPQLDGCIGIVRGWHPHQLLQTL